MFKSKHGFLDDVLGVDVETEKIRAFLLNRISRKSPKLHSSGELRDDAQLHTLL